MWVVSVITEMKAVRMGDTTQQKSNHQEQREGNYPHPSHRPNRLYSRRVQSRPGFSSLSRSLPLSGRLVNDEPLDDRGRAIDSVLTLGGDAESGSREGLG